MARASTAAENAALVVTSMLYVSLHTADPGTTGASEVTGGSYARVSVTWGAASGGVRANTNALTINLPATTTAAYFGLYDASTAGNYQIGGALSPTVTTGSSAGTVTIAIGALTVAAT